MKIASILILTTLFASPQALAQEGRAKPEAERVQGAREKQQGQDAGRTQKARDQKQAQDADRTQKARDQNKAQDADRTQKARDQNQDKEAERMKALRLERQANRPVRVITGGRVQPRRGAQVQRAPQARAAEVQKGAQGEAQRSDQARRARADEQRQQVSEFTQLVRDHRVRLAKITRLEGVYAGQGDKAKADRVRALRKRELQNFERIVARSRKQLGNEHYKSVAKRLKLDD